MNATQAMREAKARLRENQKINDAEFGYSPSTGAVGIRWDCIDSFRVFNIHYPMYGESEKVSDWVSVGKGACTKNAKWWGRKPNTVLPMLGE